MSSKYILKPQTFNCTIYMYSLQDELKSQERKTSFLLKRLLQKKTKKHQTHTGVQMCFFFLFQVSEACEFLMLSSLSEDTLLALCDCLSSLNLSHHVEIEFLNSTLSHKVSKKTKQNKQKSKETKKNSHLIKIQQCSSK